MDPVIEGREHASPPIEYEQLISRIRELVHRYIPVNATVLVVSRGDDVLLQLGRRRALHFPCDEQGKWAGFHPEDSQAAIDMVENGRREGAEYFLLPATSFWWLDYYEGLRRHLESNYRLIEANEYCWIVQLSAVRNMGADTVSAPVADTASMLASKTGLAHPLREILTGLLPGDARIVFLTVGTGQVADLDADQVCLMPSGPEPDLRVAIDRLDALSRNGFRFVVIPEPVFDWLDDHPAVIDHIRDRHRFITRQDHVCEIYELRPEAPDPAVPRPAEPNHETRTAADPSPSPSGRSFGDLLRGILSSRRNGKHT